jgi:hypothetical protein
LNTKIQESDALKRKQTAELKARRSTVHDIQDKVEKLYDPQARRLLYAELQKAKHERNESHILLTSTSKTLKLLRSEKYNLLYVKVMYSSLLLGSYSDPNCYI